MTAHITSAQADRPGRRMAVSLSALAGVGYSAAWIISLSVGAPNPSVAASGSQVVAALPGTAGRPWLCSPSPRASPRSRWWP
jgi:hypothetical protein